MKNYIAVLLCLIAIQAHAQTGVGKVVGTLDPKFISKNASISLGMKGQSARTTVDNKGAFAIASPDGQQTFQVLQDEKLLIELPILVKQTGITELGQLDIPYHEIIDEVIITGQHKPESLRKSVYQVRVINRERIELRAPNNVQEILSTELGFRFSNDLTLGTTDVQLMGMSGRNVKILLDGVPMVDRSDTRESLNQIDVNNIERIEIVEGPMSVVYGSDALAGVINIITKKSNFSRFNVQARVQEETVGKEYEFSEGLGKHNKYLGLAFQKKGFELSGGLTRSTFGGWKIGPSTSTELASGQWLPKDQWLMNAKVGYRNSDFNVWYRLDKVDEILDSKGPMNPNNFKAKFAEYNTDRLAHQLQASWTINSKLSLSGMMGHTDLSRATRTVIHDFVNNTEELSGGQGEQDLAQFNATFFRSTLHYQIGKNVSLQPGLEFNRDGASGARIKGSPSINDYAFFVSAEWELSPKLSIRPGLRTIKNSIYEAPPIIPAINAKLSISDNLSLRMGYAQGFRAPALRELYFDFFDASHSIMGNENLKAERSNSFTGSLVLHQHKEDLQWSSTLNGFYNKFTDRIDYAVSSDDASITSLINVGIYKTVGGSLENRIDFKNLTLNLGFSHIGRYNRLTEQPTTLGELPEFGWASELNSSLIYRLNKLATDINLSYKYSGSIPGYELYDLNGAQAARQIKTGSFSLADLIISKRVKQNFVVNLGVKNIFDVTTITNTRGAGGSAHGSSGGSVPLSYGRSFALGLQYNFSTNN